MYLNLPKHVYGLSCTVLLISCLLRALGCETGARTVDPDILKDLPYWTLIEIMVVSWNSAVKFIDNIWFTSIEIVFAFDYDSFRYDLCMCGALLEIPLHLSLPPTIPEFPPHHDEMRYVRNAWTDTASVERTTTESWKERSTAAGNNEFLAIFWFEMFIFWALRRWQCATCPLWRMNGWSEALWTLQEVTRT